MPVSSKRRPHPSPLVLVVDDYEDTRRIYVEYLRFAGFRAVSAKDGDEAYAKARELGPDVAIMDLAMPGVDGWEATRRMKEDPQTRDIYVIAVTGFGEDEHRRRACDAGCDVFLVKPVPPAQLVRRIVGRLSARAES